MPVTVPPKAKAAYMEYLRDEERFRIPGRNLEDFNVQHHFLDNIMYAKQSLEGLISSIVIHESPLEMHMDVHTEFIVTGHGKVRLVEGQPDGVKLLIGQSAMSLDPTGVELAKSQYDPKHGENLVITSHLVRAMQHALVRYYPQEEAAIGTKVGELERTFLDNGLTVDRTRLIDLMGFALDHGIIPTLLLGSHYHGPRDCFPENPQDYEIGIPVGEFLKRSVFRDVPTADRDWQYALALRNQGRSPFMKVVTDEGEVFTENMLLYAYRVDELLTLFAPGSPLYNAVDGQVVNFVGHSSNVDVISSYFQHFGHPSSLIFEKKPKSITRHANITIKVDDGLIYLN
ncbi:MAG: hypothetical protein KJ922_03130, partial [Nanoarchaeota archaeon]|nr:hypothetical protein [Nanoarchaeota archaeon]